MTGRPVDLDQNGSILDRLLRKNGILYSEIHYKFKLKMSRYTLNKEQLKKWLKNLLLFTAPIMAVFFGQLALGVPIRDSLLVASLAIYGMAADYFKKLNTPSNGN